MLGKVSYDAEGMVAAAEKARALRDNVEQTRKELVKQYMTLLDSTSTLGLRTGEALDLASVVSQKALREQKERLEDMATLLNEAAGLTDKATNEVTNTLEGFFLTNFLRGTDGKIHINPATSLGAAATAIGSTFGMLHSSVCSAIPGGIMQHMQGKFDEGKEKIDALYTAVRVHAFIGVHPDAAFHIELLRKNNYTDKDICDLIEKGGEEAVKEEAERYNYASPLGDKVTKVNKDAMYPRYSGGSKHNGIDIYAKKGTPLYAIKGGTILFARKETLASGKPAMGGNCILILGKDGLYYYYAHLNGFNVKKSMTVATGDLIGWTGNTSNRSLAAHLHLTIAIPLKSPIPVPTSSIGKYWLGNKQGYVIDPYAYLQNKIELIAK